MPTEGIQHRHRELKAHTTPSFAPLALHHGLDQLSLVLQVGVPALLVLLPDATSFGLLEPALQRVAALVRGRLTLGYGVKERVPAVDGALLA